MKNIRPLIMALVLLLSFNLTAQIAINNENSAAAGSAVLDLSSTTRGFLMPRMTGAQIAAIVNPADGLQVYNTDDGKRYIFVMSANQWKAIAYGTANIIPPYFIPMPFFDDFESEDDVSFEYWTAENIEGWHYWHVIAWGGNNGDHCMRFENTDIVQDDWLLTKPIYYEGDHQLKITFDTWFHGDRIQPTLLYTTQYNGNASESTWTELNYSLGENEYEWYSSGELILDKPGNVLYFAFHYQSDLENSIYILLDNFSVTEYIPPVEYEHVANSEHFAYYNSIDGEEDFYLQVQDILEAKYQNYVSLWDRPGRASVFPFDTLISVRFCQRDNIPSFNENTPGWKCGSINFSGHEIYLSPLNTADQQDYYGDLASLAANQVSQLALTGKFYRNNDNNYDDWYLEGFGLYEMAYRPSRDDLLQKLNDLGTEEPPVESLTDISQLNLPGNKDLMASLFESKALVGCYYHISSYNDLYNWWVLLDHYYIQEGSERIRLIYATDNFNYYGNEYEIPFIEDLALDMEGQFQMQESRFEIEIHHKVNVCIYEVEVGLEMSNRTDFQGVCCGADRISCLPMRIPDDYSLMHHEFMHVLVNILSRYEPGQFLNEGLAESTDGFMPDEEMPYHRYKIQGLYFHYQNKYFREPTFLEIVDNAEAYVEEDPFWVDAYALGEMYWRFMFDKYPSWILIKEFLMGGRDWTVFSGRTMEEEGAEFIQFMKELAFVGPPLDTLAIPFYEDFETDFDGWTLMRYGADDHWQIQENAGIDDSYCAFAVDPYWLEEKDVDSWLVSPPLNATDSSELEVSFMYKQFGQGIKPEIYYGADFTSPVESTDWILVNSAAWDAQEGVWDSIKFTIVDPPERLFVAIRFISEEGNFATYIVDNFSVHGPTPPEYTELPFYDDFEESIGEDAVFLNWTGINLEGWNFWHIIPWGGIGGSQCMRFENSDIVQDDWLITNPINCESTDTLRISFNHYYWGDLIKPVLVYTNQFNGDPGQSTWTELNYSLGENDYEWYSSGTILLENPGDVIYIAFHYLSDVDNTIYFLLDNFSVTE